MVGDGNAPNFFVVNSNNGQITIRSDIDVETTEVYRLRMIARDLQEAFDEMIVQVTINRNLFAPELLQVSYTAQIPENYPLGQAIRQIEAEDQDRNDPWMELDYEIVGDSTSLTYTQINGDGDVSLKQTLANANIDTFTVRFFLHIFIVL